MSVFSVPVTIGVNEEEIAKRIEENVEKQVVENITNDVKQIMFKRDYCSGKYNDPTPLRDMVKNQIDILLEDKKEQIIKMAAEILADRLIRTKAVKEAAVDVVKKTK